MNILVYAPLAVLGHHFETDLEIIQNHLDQGDDVTVVTCDAYLSDLKFMACKGVLRCEYCQSRCQQGLSLLRNTQKLTHLSLGKLLPVDCTTGKIDLTSNDQVKSLNYKGADIGSTYISSLISDLRNPMVDLGSRVKQTRTSLHLLAAMTDRFEQLLDENQPKKVYFFNGRFSLYRPLLRMCQQKKIEFFVHERGGSNLLYSLTLNNMPHDIATKEREMSTLWQDPRRNEEEKVGMSSDWFEKRAMGKGTAWYSFTDKQDLTELPPCWNSKNQNISIFVSSDDEFAEVPGWEIGMFDTQAHAVSHILNSFSTQPEFRFYIRMHPNLRGLRNRDIDALRRLGDQNPNCVVIPPESTVSSYTLLRRSNKVICFGSTTGIEAAYMGTPSILVGKSFYMNLGSTYKPESPEALEKLVGSKQLAPLPREGALKYGYWAKTVGEPFRHYRPISLTTGEFNGQMIVGKRRYMFANYLSVALLDIKKIIKGEYGLSHLIAKVKAKTKLLRA